MDLRSKTNTNIMSQDQFTQAFITALQNDSVVDQLERLLCAKLKKEITVLHDEMQQKDVKITELEKRVTELSQSNDNLEQYSRRNSLRIFGKEETDNEDPAKVAFDLINKDLKLDIKVKDRAHRVGKRTKVRTAPRPILVKFATYADRDAVYRQRTILKGSRIFINEDLTQQRSALLYTARTFKRNTKIKDCWSHDGQILIKNNHGRVIGIKKEKDLIEASK